MTNAPPPIATQVYQACVLLYPSTFRSQFGEEMISDFDAATRDAWHSRGWHGVLSLWALVSADLVRSIAVQWFRTGLPALAVLSIVWSIMMCSLVAQQFVPDYSPPASGQTDDQALLIMVLGSAVVVLLIVATVIITGCFWMLVVRRRSRA